MLRSYIILLTLNTASFTSFYCVAKLCASGVNILIVFLIDATVIIIINGLNVYTNYALAFFVLAMKLCVTLTYASGFNNLIFNVVMSFVIVILIGISANCTCVLCVSLFSTGLKNSLFELVLSTYNRFFTARNKSNSYN
jgi:hypothetical protein